MPRDSRIDFPGAFHHVYARGIEKRKIFLDDRDKGELRRRIRVNLEKFEASCLAWAFMPNHFHLIFFSNKGNLSGFMRCVMTGYANYFNRKHDRAGHLFQNRYRSSLIDSARYLLELIRYIHLNPIRAGIVSSMEQLSAYPWTSHYDIRRAEDFPWKEFQEIYDFFACYGETEGFSRYLDFLKEGVDPERSADGGAHVDCLQPAAATSGRNFPLMPEAESIPNEFMKIVDRCCIEFGITPECLFNRRDRTSVNARKKTLHISVVEKGMPAKAVCSWLGLTRSGGAYLLRSNKNAFGQEPSESIATSPDW
ncbi:MAG: transposase [Deltaproteobacteria bacterium]|nr:transposase [Deltaproteobacteria bacterium]